jgi:hypothetical protein
MTCNYRMLDGNERETFGPVSTGAETHAERRAKTHAKQEHFGKVINHNRAWVWMIWIVSGVRFAIAGVTQQAEDGLQFRSFQ